MNNMYLDSDCLVVKDGATTYRLTEEEILVIVRSSELIKGLKKLIKDTVEEKVNERNKV